LAELFGQDDLLLARLVLELKPTGVEEILEIRWDLLGVAHVGLHLEFFLQLRGKLDVNCKKCQLSL